MKIYTKHGDKGMTSLASGMQIFKSDERVETLGNIDELTSQIGLAKVLVQDEKLRAGLERVQNNLMTVMAGIAEPRNAKYVLPEDEVAFLEAEIDRMSGGMAQEFHFVLPGACELSARLDVARTVARRSERRMVTMDRKYSAHSNSQVFLNRLSDYLYAAARSAELQQAIATPYTPSTAQTYAMPAVTAPAIPAAAVSATAAPQTAGLGVENVVQEVLKQMGEYRPLNLEKVKRLIEAVEKYAAQQGKKAVIAVCNAEGNPIAVHVMDGAFLVSYEVAVKKAYTSVAVKMSTMELSKLAQPGQTFYGLANLEKMVIFGGGVPLMENGHIIGGLGISGGTGEEDHALCEYALSIFPTL